MKICKRSGLSFEPSSPQQKQHPAISAWLRESSRDGWYRECVEAIDRGEREGLSSLDDFAELIAEAKKRGIKSSEERANAERQEEQRYKDERTRRAIVKETLHRNEYRWRSYQTFSEDSPFGMADDSGKTEFWLQSPDGREVSEKQALKEIYANPSSIVKMRSGRWERAGSDKSLWFPID